MFNRFQLALASWVILSWISCGVHEEPIIEDAPPLAITDDKEALISQLQARIPEWMEAALIPGISMAIIKDAELIWRGSFGVKNVETEQPVDEDTVFEAASLSKPVFAYGVMKLVDDGKLDLDKPLADYVDEADLHEAYPKTIDGDMRFKQITARMILTHCTGFPNWFGSGPMRFLFDPGEKFSYSGEAFSYLAVVVQTLTGESLNDFAKRLVFQPLGMETSNYFWQESYNPHFAGSHNYLRELERRNHRTVQLAGASLYTTATDYAKFIIAIMNGTGLSEAVHNEMLRPQIDVPARYGDGEPVLTWGLGVGTNQTDQGDTFWHWGDNGNFKAYFEASRETELGVVYFSNGSNGLAIADMILKLTTGLAKPAITTPYFRYHTLDTFALKLYHTYKTGGVDAVTDLTETVDTPSVGEEVSTRDAYSTIGRHAMTNDNVEGARTLFELALKLYPEDGGLHISLGGIHLLRGNPDLGREYFDKLFELGDDWETDINSMGYVLLRNEKVDEAIEVFKINTEKYPDSANCHDSLGEAYLTKGDREQAVFYYEKALEIDPNLPSATAALERLRNEK